MSLRTPDEPVEHQQLQEDQEGLISPGLSPQQQDDLPPKSSQRQQNLDKSLGIQQRDSLNSNQSGYRPFEAEKSNLTLLLAIYAIQVLLIL